MWFADGNVCYVCAFEVVEEEEVDKEHENPMLRACLPLLANGKPHGSLPRDMSLVPL